MQGTQVQSLVMELRSCILCSGAKQNLKGQEVDQVGLTEKGTFDQSLEREEAMQMSAGNIPARRISQCKALRQNVPGMGEGQPGSYGD